MGARAAKNKGELLENNFVVSSKIACDFFGISRETLSTWAEKGAPKEARGKWNLKSLMEWRYKGETLESPAVRKLKAEADLKETKAKQEKIKLNVTEERFLPVDEVRFELTRLLMNFKKSMLAIGHNVAAELTAAAGAEVAEVARNEVDKRIHDALEEVSKYGKYTGRRGKAKKSKSAL